MFDFGHDEEIELVSNSVENFASDMIYPRMRDFEAARRVDRDVVQDFQELGLHLMSAPEGLGGIGLGAKARLAVNQALGRADPGAALALDRIGLALEVTRAFGGEDAQMALSARCMNGLESTSTQVVVVSDDLLTGKSENVSADIPWVPANETDLLLLLNKHGLWVITDNMVFTECRGSGLRASGAASVQVDNASVVLQWQDALAARKALAQYHLYASALMIGVMDAACRFSREYAKERVAFGKPIAHHQALAFEMVDMELAVTAVRCLAEEAADLIDSGEEASGAAAMAFVEAIEASHLIGPGAVQVLGGHGFMADFPQEKAMREVRALGLWAGGIERAKDASYTSYMGAES